MNERPFLDLDEADRLWNDIAPELGVAVAAFIRKMRWPEPPQGPQGVGSVPLPSPREVVLALAEDRDLRDEVVHEIRDAYWAAAKAGRIRRDGSRRYAFCLAKRVAQRTARKHAQLMCAQVKDVARAGANGEAGRAASLSDLPATIDIERVLDLWQNWLRLEVLLRELTIEEFLVLTEPVEGVTYEELAVRLGKTAGAVRVQALRLRRRLCKQLTATEEAQDEHETG